MFLSVARQGKVDDEAFALSLLAGRGETRQIVRCDAPLKEVYTS